MPILHIIILSIVQGLTEFLPVSSSGHLVLVPRLLGLPDQGLDMDLAVHIGTLMAVLVYYRRDVLNMILAVLFWNDKKRKSDQRLAIYIALSTIPIGILGFMMHKVMPDGIRDVWVITATTLIFGAVLGLADHFGKTTRTLDKITFKSAFAIGCAQALALIPGTSRSGITITTARFLGFNRVEAARFSFLLSIPATMGAGLLGVLDAVKEGNAALGMDMALAAGFTFIAGLGAIAFMVRFLKKYGLMPYVIYRLALGVSLLIFAVF